MTVSSTDSLPRLDAALYGRPAGRNIIDFAIEELQRLRTRCAEHEEFRHQHRDCNAMGVENQCLRAERVALRADADRYRWLRGDSCGDHSPRWTQWEIRCWRAPQWTADLRRAELDAAIDAAFRAAVREIGAINAAPYITAEELREKLRDSLGKRWCGLTQREVAESCGVSEAFLSAVLRGHKDPGNTIAKAFRYERVVLYRKIAQEGSKS